RFVPLRTSDAIRNDDQAHGVSPVHRTIKLATGLLVPWRRPVGSMAPAKNFALRNPPATTALLTIGAVGTPTRFVARATLKSAGRDARPADAASERCGSVRLRRDGYPGASGP